MSDTQWSLLLAIVAAVATVVGGLIVVFPNRIKGDKSPHIIAFGAGFMLAAAFLKMIPESMKLLGTAPLWILAGYVLAHLFEHTFTPHFHFGEETHAEHLFDPSVSVSAFVGLFLHAIFDGISISAGFLVTSSLGFFIALAVILHKIPEGVTMSSVMLVSGRGKRAALNSTIALAVATVLGSLIMFRLAPFKGFALALSAGIATYVAATDLLPELNKLKEMRYSLGALLGIVFFFGVEVLLETLGVA